MKNKDNLNQNIQLILNYHGRSVIIEMQKYKSLVAVKQKIFDIFYPVKHNITIFLNNKNLESLIAKPLGLIFPGESLVSLNIEDEKENNSPYKIVYRLKQSPLTNDLLTNYKKNYSNIKKNYKKNNSLGKNNESIFSPQNKLGLFKIKLTKIPNTTKNIRRLHNCSSFDFINVNKYQTGIKKIKKLPPLNLNISNNKTRNNNMVILYNKCNDCYINDIIFYCRACDEFICKKCSINIKSVHLSHQNYFLKLIQDSNYENVIKYKKVINNKLKKSLACFNNIGNKEEEDNKCNDNSNKTRNGSCAYAQILNSINNNVHKLVDKTTEITDSLQEIDRYENDDVTKNEEMIKICKNEVKVLKEFDVYKYVSPFQPFFVLNNYEKNMNQYFNKNKMNNDERKYIKEQIEDLFGKIEKEIDNSLDEIEAILGDKNLLK